MKHQETKACLIFVAATVASVSCMAQNVSENGTGAPLPPATHLQRCADFGAFVKKAAIARDLGESPEHFAGHARLHTPYALVLDATHAVFASSYSPDVLRERTVMQCDRNNRATRGTYGYWRR